MKHLLHLLLIVLIGLSSCMDDTETIPTNGDLLFPSSLPLDIKLSDNHTELPIFELADTKDQITIIAISTDELVVQNNGIINTNSIIWEWRSNDIQQTIIQLQDGTFSDALSMDNSNESEIICTFSDYDALYWTAWSWNADRTIVQYSTPINSFPIIQKNNDDFVVSNVSITDTNKDGYFNAGERVNVKLTLEYTGQFPLSSFISKLSSSSIVELPIIIEKDSFVNNTFDLIYNITLPANAAYQEDIPLQLNLDYNSCFKQLISTVKIPITGRAVCLVSIRLKRIYTNPPNGDTWDSYCIIPIFPPYTNPDPCYTLASVTQPYIYSNCPSENSGELEDVDPKFPDAEWPALTPCHLLVLDDLYSIRVLEENKPWCEDNEYIGEVSFTPSNFLDSTLHLQIVESETIQVELRLEWQ